MPARLNKDKKVTGLRLFFRSPVFMLLNSYKNYFVGATIGRPQSVIYYF